MESINIYLLISVQTDYPTNCACCPSIKTTEVGCTAVSAGWRRTSGSPLLHSGLIARDGLRRIDTSTVAVHALEIRVAQRSKGRYPPGGVEGKELLEKREGEAQLVNGSDGWRTSSRIWIRLVPLRGPVLARPCPEQNSLLA